MLMMLIVLSAWTVLPALVATAIIAFVFRGRRISQRSPVLSALLVGVAVPFLMLVYGLYLAWPWPWFTLQHRYDGLGQPGAWLVVTVASVLAACLAVSWIILGIRNRAVS